MSKRYVVMVTDHSGNVTPLFESDSKASAANKARSFKKDGAYASAEVVDTQPTVAEKQEKKAKTKAKAKAAPKEKKERTYKINFKDLGEAALARADDERVYISWVRREAPKAVGMTNADFVNEFGRGHVWQADVILLSEQAPDKVWEFFTSNPTRANLAKALDDAGLETTRTGMSRLPRFGKAREEWLEAYRAKRAARNGEAA